MKNTRKIKKLDLHKTKISILKNPYTIKGGNDGDDDDVTRTLPLKP